MNSNCGGESERRLIKIKWVSDDGNTKHVRKMYWPPPSPTSESLTQVMEPLYSGLWYRFDRSCTMTSMEPTMQYMDNDGDWVTISTTCDLDAALSAQKLRPFVLFVFMCRGIDCLPEQMREKLISNLVIPKATIYKTTKTYENVTLALKVTAKSQHMIPETNNKPGLTESSDPKSQKLYKDLVTALVNFAKD